MLRNEQFFIFSAENKDNNVMGNINNTEELREHLKNVNIPYKEIEGKADNILETSFIVTAKYENEIYELAEKYNQDTILFVNSKSNSVLFNLKGDILSKGKFIETTFDEKGENYNFDIDKGKYYKIV